MPTISCYVPLSAESPTTTGYTIYREKDCGCEAQPRREVNYYFDYTTTSDTFVKVFDFTPSEGQNWLADISFSAVGTGVAHSGRIVASVYRTGGTTGVASVSTETPSVPPPDPFPEIEVAQSGVNPAWVSVRVHSGAPSTTFNWKFKINIML